MDVGFLWESARWAGFYLGVGAALGYLMGVARERRRHYRIYHRKATP